MAKTKTEYIHIRVNDEQLTEIKKQADQLGLPLSTFARLKLLASKELKFD